MCWCEKAIRGENKEKNIGGEKMEERKIITEKKKDRKESYTDGHPV